MIDVNKVGTIRFIFYMTVTTITGKGENGSAMQAVIVENLYRLWFSMPKMACITWWDLGDVTPHGKEDKALAGLLDVNMNEDAYKVTDSLIK